MICDACFGNEYKKPQMIFLGWGSGTVCPECLAETINKTTLEDFE